MTVPKEPIFAVIFIAHWIACLSCVRIAQALTHRPEWPGIIVGNLVMAFFLANQTDKNGKQLNYSGNSLWIFAGVRTGALIMFWFGLTFDVYASTDLARWVGLVISAVGVTVSVVGGIVQYKRSTGSRP